MSARRQAGPEDIMAERPGYYGNTNASKPPEKRRSANLNVRVRPDDLDAWRRKAQAQGKSLSEWVTDSLRAAP